MIGAGSSDTALSEAARRDLCATEIARWSVGGKRVLAVVPDGTRTAPMGTMFRVLHGLLAKEAARFDVMIALGTHPPMSEDAINARFELSSYERTHTYGTPSF